MSPCTSASPSRTASSAACSSSSMFERSHASSNTPSASVPSGSSRIGPQPSRICRIRCSKVSAIRSGGGVARTASRVASTASIDAEIPGRRPRCARQVLEHECGLGAVVVPAEERRQIVPSAQRLVVRPLDPQPVRGVVEGRDLREGARAVGERHDPAAVRRCAVPAGRHHLGRTLADSPSDPFRVRLVHRRILAAAEGVTPPRRPGGRGPLRGAAAVGWGGAHVMCIWAASRSQDLERRPACTRLRACVPVRCARARPGDASRPSAGALSTARPRNAHQTIRTAVRERRPRRHG